jgi:hypothetical protein
MNLRSTEAASIDLNAVLSRPTVFFSFFGRFHRSSD